MQKSEVKIKCSDEINAKTTVKIRLIQAPGNTRGGIRC
jgi:hypothetical protein